MTKVLTICFMFMFVSVVGAEELVVNKDGNLVLLKDDHTWELWEEIDTPGGDGKVVFRIIEGVNKHEARKIFDDFDEFSHYVNMVGCEYTVEVENKTEHKIKVNYPAIRLRPGSGSITNLYFDQVLEPGQKSAKSSLLDSNWRGVKETEKQPTGPEVEQLFQQFGCDRQSGRVQLFEGRSAPIVTFSKESNIFGSAARMFVETSQTGKYPLIEEIRWDKKHK